jgi:hypothetical protein
LKKITVLVLVLGLTVPAQAWHLFPVRKEIVTVEKTNYAVTAATFVITLVASLVAGKLIFGHKQTREISNDEMWTKREDIRKEINDSLAPNGGWAVECTQDANTHKVQWTLYKRINSSSLYEKAQDAFLRAYVDGRTTMEYTINEDLKKHRLAIAQVQRTGCYSLNIITGEDRHLEPVGELALDAVWDFVSNQYPDLRPEISGLTDRIHKLEESYRSAEYCRKWVVEDANRVIEERDRLQEQYDELKKRYDRLAGNSETDTCDEEESAQTETAESETNTSDDDDK